MTTYRLLANQIIDKRKITDAEVDRLCSFVYRDHTPNLEDVRELTSIYISLLTSNDKFDKFYFGALKQIILEDGEIQPAEQFYLLQLLYSDRTIRPVELEFLRELKRDARVPSPEFNELCKTAFQATATNWDVGGTSSSTNTTVLCR